HLLRDELLSAPQVGVYLVLVLEVVGDGGVDVKEAQRGVIAGNVFRGPSRQILAQDGFDADTIALDADIVRLQELEVAVKLHGDLARQRSQKGLAVKRDDACARAADENAADGRL